MFISPNFFTTAAYIPYANAWAAQIVTTIDSEGFQVWATSPKDHAAKADAIEEAKAWGQAEDMRFVDALEEIQ